MKSRKKLLEELKDIVGSGVAKAELPESPKQFSDEVFGRKAMIFLPWHSQQDKRAGEMALRWRGFKVHQYDVDSTSMIQVSYFKGWHWDE